MRLDLIKRAIFSSPARQFNLGLTYLSRFLRLKRPWGLPVKLMVEPANFCNLRCPTCPVGKGEIAKSQGTMDLADFQRLIDEAGDYIYHLTLWNWGEPFLNKDLPEMIACAKRKKIYVVTSTNGHFLTPEIAERMVASGLDELIIALDGLSQETLERYRVGANLETILKGVKNLVAAKAKQSVKTPILELQFITMKHNEHELPRLAEFARMAGFDKAVIKTFGTHLDADRLREFEPEDKKLSRYNRPVKAKNDCPELWRSMNINYDGNVVPCCYDPQEKHVLGNVFQSGVRAVWQGPAYAAFRQAVLAKKQAIDICRNCDYNKEISQKINLN